MDGMDGMDCMVIITLGRAISYQLEKEHQPIHGRSGLNVMVNLMIELK